ncbi:MAG: hypothetical protein KatS3mg014_1573 [Actinomycetota bacterium]|nr:MAG: hypothetical protein KatS3mg014_1573 [Actinomycetota bacterium]
MMHKVSNVSKEPGAVQEFDRGDPGGYDGGRPLKQRRCQGGGRLTGIRVPASRLSRGGFALFLLAAQLVVLGGQAALATHPCFQTSSTDLTNGADVWNDPLNVANTIGALAGDDTLSGNGGADKLCGEEGADSISGGNGNDQINGGFGAESGTKVLDGGDGTDLIHGGEDPDKVWGGAGDDRAGSTPYLYGDKGADNIRGQAGNDYADGGEGLNDDCIAESEINCEI